MKFYRSWIRILTCLSCVYIYILNWKLVNALDPLGVSSFKVKISMECYIVKILICRVINSYEIIYHRWWSVDSFQVVLNWLGNADSSVRFLSACESETFRSWQTETTDFKQSINLYRTNFCKYNVRDCIRWYCKAIEACSSYVGV